MPGARRGTAPVLRARQRFFCALPVPAGDETLKISPLRTAFLPPWLPRWRRARPKTASHPFRRKRRCTGRMASALLPMAWASPPAGRDLPVNASARQRVADVRRRTVRQTGGLDGVTAGGMPGAGPWDPTSQNGEGAAKPALPIRPKARHRPDRLHFQPSARGTAASCRPRRRARKHEEDAA